MILKIFLTIFLILKFNLIKIQIILTDFLNFNIQFLLFDYFFAYLQLFYNFSSNSKKKNLQIQIYLN